MTYHPTRAGNVRRWHSNPDLSHIHDTNDAHQGRCGVLVMTLWPDHSHMLLKAAITHDLGECVTGDMNGQIKHENPDLAEMLAQIERRYLAKWGFDFDLTDTDARRLYLVDKLDAYLVVKSRAPWVLIRADWKQSYSRILNMADSLGVKSHVLEIID